jgi:hypothetical protein
MYKIETGIAIPSATRYKGGRKPKYPFAELKVGESFLVPNKTTDKFGATVTLARKRTGMNFATRNVEGGVRIWRTA